MVVPSSFGVSTGTKAIDVGFVLLYGRIPILAKFPAMSLMFSQGKTLEILRFTSQSEGCDSAVSISSVEGKECGVGVVAVDFKSGSTAAPILIVTRESEAES